MAKHRLLNHYRGAPTPKVVEAHIRFLRDFAAWLV